MSSRLENFFEFNGDLLLFGKKMAFGLAAFSYIVALIIDAFLIFFAIFHVSTLNGFLINLIEQLKHR